MARGHGVPNRHGDESEVELKELILVSRELLNQLEVSRQDRERFDECLKSITDSAQKLGANWMTSAFGSAASGFFTHFSDLDVTCYQVQESPISAKQSLALLHPLVLQDPAFELVEVISAARVPILKVKYDQVLDVDISFQNVEPLPNTRLLEAYARLSPVVRELVKLVKAWAQGEGVCGAHEGHLSSYAFTLMTVYFLQVDPLVMMPCLPTQAFVGAIAGKHFVPDLPEFAKKPWECPVPVAVLICRFFSFYAVHHCWGCEVVSIRNGTRLYVTEPIYTQLGGRTNNQMLHIEDPFLLHRNLNCVLGEMQHVMLCEKLRLANAAAQIGRPPQGFTTAVAANEQKMMLRASLKPRMNQLASAPNGQTTDLGSHSRDQLARSQSTSPKEQNAPKLQKNGKHSKIKAMKAEPAPAAECEPTYSPSADEVPMTTLCQKFAFTLQ